MIEARASAKYVRTSAQKAGLVLDQIRGRDVNQALAALRYSRKSVAREVEKVLRSAIANAQQQDGFGGDVDRLYVLTAYADQGPSQKRVRPAPMGRAFRVVKRTAHLTVRIAERPLEIETVPEPPKRVPAKAKQEGQAAEAQPAAAPKAERKPRAKASSGKRAAAKAKAKPKAPPRAKRAVAKTKKGE